MRTGRPIVWRRVFVSILTLLALDSVVWGQGVVFPAAGPVNRSMGGAAVGAPLDAAGALYWNPATTAGLPNSEMLFATGFVYGSVRMTSAVAPGAFGPGFPPTTLAGTDRSDPGLAIVPTFALVYKPEESDWSFGVGAFAAGGFFTNYPADPSNPLLSPFPPNGVGNGPIFASASFAQFTGTATYQLTEHLAIGGGPIVDAATVQAVPGVFAPLNAPNANGSVTYPPATDARASWGLGFQVGLYGTVGNGWQFGTSFKSPQWFETFRYHSLDQQGFPRELTLRLDRPLVVSVGGGYSGFERWLLAVDVRYLDYRDVAGFGSPARVDPSGAFTGFGWHSVFAVAAGAQYQWTDKFSARLGYLYNGLPIGNDVTFFNVASSVIFQHSIYLGASYQITKALKVSAVYSHTFQDSIQGPFFNSAGPIPGTLVKVGEQTDGAEIGFSVCF
jgi:long-chain fatty acid transport protein